jgi:ABC-2 type transport system ATP-binding protein
MSIEVRNLTKVYDGRKAVDDISFRVRPGEIVGFLGPNGAGKSTTFKMLTGFVPPSSGSASVCDTDTQHPQVRKWIGYLAEHNPLYLDMFVHEFLEFSGRLTGLSGSGLKRRVGQIIEQCGITPEQNKRLEQLSKGYRQRVGLAHALLHEPKVLVLDEPTTGLDPNQIVEIRQLIKSISHDRTVIFSSHILQEVEALCDRVLVINEGRIVADDLLSRILSHHSGSDTFIAEFDQPVAIADLERIPGVVSVSPLSGSSYKLISSASADLRPAVFRFAADNNLSLLGLRREDTSLESVFKSLTKTQVPA